MSALVRPRPVGVTVLAILVGLQALDDLLSFFVDLGAGNIVGGIVVGILAVATITLVVGLWTLRRWAFWTAIVLEVIYLLFALLNLAQSASPASLIERVLLEIVIPLIVLICLFAVRNVRAAILRR
jgi:uncharacterized membrane protein (DUF2068 family)